MSIEFLKQNKKWIIGGLVGLVIIATIVFVIKNNKTKPLSSFKVFKKRLDDSKASPSVATFALTEENTTILQQIAMDLCGKNFNTDKLNLYLQNSDKLKEYFNLTLTSGLDLTSVLVIAIMKSNMTQDKKVDYMASLWLEQLLNTTGILQIEYNKEKAEVKLLDNVFRKAGITPSAEVISVGEFGNHCYNFIEIYANPDSLKKVLSKTSSPQEQKDNEIASSKQIFDAVTIDKVCAMLS